MGEIKSKGLNGLLLEVMVFMMTLIKLIKQEKILYI